MGEGLWPWPASTSGRLANEGEGHVVDAVLHAEREVLPVFSVNAGVESFAPRQVHPLVREPRRPPCTTWHSTRPDTFPSTLSSRLPSSSSTRSRAGGPGGAARR